MRFTPDWRRPSLLCKRFPAFFITSYGIHAKSNHDFQLFVYKLLVFSFSWIKQWIFQSMIVITLKLSCSSLSQTYQSNPLPLFSILHFKRCPIFYRNAQSIVFTLKTCINSQSKKFPFEVNKTCWSIESKSSFSLQCTKKRANSCVRN